MTRPAPPPRPFEPGGLSLFELQHTGPTPVCWSYGMGGHTRLWLAHRRDDHRRDDQRGGRYPQVEEFYVAAPAQVQDKARAGFAARWRNHAGEDLHTRKLDAAVALQELTGTPAAVVEQLAWRWSAQGAATAG